MDRLILFCTFSVVLTGLTSGAGLLPHDSVNAAVGDSVMFTTSMDPTQTPFVSITWQCGTKNITNIITSNTGGNFTGPEYESRITLFISTGSLELRNVALGDTGEYQVTIIPAGSAQMVGTTTLNVFEKIENASIEASSDKPIEGISFNLTCDGSGSNISREWMINGSNLNSSENIVFYDQNRVLSFKVLNRKDNGEYTCKISNPISSQRAFYLLNVIYGPENVQISGLNEVEVQTTLKLSCSSDTVPAASYTWIKNETTIATSSEFTKDITGFSDSGEYICQATNDITMKTSNASYTVLITEPSTDGLSGGAIAGITIACLAVAGAAIGAGVYFTKKR